MEGGVEVFAQVRDATPDLAVAVVSDSVLCLGGAMARTGTGGRPGKGDRDALITDVAVPLGEAVRARADQAGLSVSDYVATILAKEHGLPEHAPTPHDKARSSAA